MSETVYPVREATTLMPFLLQTMKGFSRNTLKSLLSGRQILVDGRPTTQFDAPLAVGQTVSLLPKGGPTGAVLPFPLLYEDDELLVVDKPCGLLSIATDKEKSATAYHAVTDYVRARDDTSRIFVLHRLDRDTSGVLMFAKSEAVKRQFQDRWDELLLERVYLAIVEGHPEEKRGTVRSFLRETATHLVYSTEPGGDAKEAVTNYLTLARHGAYSLLRVSLETGRKNQIRVHMKDIGHPVAGDKKYGATTDPLKRMGLHAITLGLRHPVSGKELWFHAPTPAAFRNYLPKNYREPIQK